MESQKDLKSLPKDLKNISKEICWNSNQKRKNCCCHICLRILKKIYDPENHLPSSSKKTTIKDSLFFSLPFSASLSQPSESQSKWREEKETSDGTRLQESQQNNRNCWNGVRLKRSRSLEDFNVSSRDGAETPLFSKYFESCQSTGKKAFRASSTEKSVSQRILGKNSKESTSNGSGSDSEDTLPDPILILLSDDDHDDCHSDKGNASSKSSRNIKITNDLISSKNISEVKQDLNSNEDDSSQPLFNYSQEDEVILIYDSDEQEDTKGVFAPSDSSATNVGQMLPFGSIDNLEDLDTQPCPEFENHTKEYQQWTRDFFKNKEHAVKSSSPKFVKQKSDCLTRGSLENCQDLVRRIKQEEENDSGDLLHDEIDSQATQFYTQMEWEHVNVKQEMEENVSGETHRSREETFCNLAKNNDDDDDGTLKIVPSPKKTMMPSSGNENCLVEILAEDGNRDIKIKKELETAGNDNEDDDDYLCATQVDTPSAIAKSVKKRNVSENTSKVKPLSEEKAAGKNRWTTPFCVDMDDDDDDDLFWCATQVDSNLNSELLNKESFVVNDSDESEDDTYMLATQIDLDSERLPCKSSSLSTNRAGPSTQKESIKDRQKNAYLPRGSNFHEEDSDSGESMYSVATQIGDPLADLNKDAEDQSYMNETQVDPLFSSRKHENQIANILQSSSQSRKRRKLRHRSNLSVKSLKDLHRNANDSDSDDSIFSLATQIDDLDDDSLFMAATQVDSESSNNFKVPKSLRKHKFTALSLQSKALQKANEDYDSDDSAYSVATQVDTSFNYHNSISKSLVKKRKYPKRNSIESVFTHEEDYDSDSSIYSISTQIDVLDSTRKNAKKDDDDDDMDYMAATQVDVDVDSCVKPTKPVTPKDDIFKIPSFPQKKLKISSANLKEKEATNSKETKETPAKQETVADKPFSNFLLEIAEGEVETEIIVISPEKKEPSGKSEESEENFGKFLLDLSEDTAPQQTKATSQTCPVEPLRLKTKKEMRETFKNQQLFKDPLNNTKSPEKKPPPKMTPKISALNEPWLSKSKKPIPMKTKLRESKTLTMSRNINEARNQLEERYFLSHLDTSSKVGWNKASHIHYGSSSTITDVQLPDEDEIRKKGLPITDGPQRRRPLPDIPIEQYPQEKQPDISNAEVDTSPVTAELKKTPPKTSPNSSNLKKSPNTLVSTQFYRKSGLNTFKIPKIPNLLPKSPQDSASHGKSNLQPGSSAAKVPFKPPFELGTQSHPPIEKVIDSYRNINKTSMSLSSNFVHHKKQPTKPIFSSCDSSHSVINKQNNCLTRDSTRSSCSDGKNLQNRRISLKNTRDIILTPLLKWNPKWLVEQKNIKTIPPIVKMDQLVPLLNSYTSLEDYQSIFQPLLLLEIWESITKDFLEHFSKKRHWRVAFCNVQTTNSKLMDYIVYGVISTQDYNCKKQMMEGDLIIMNLQVENPEKTKDKASLRYQHYPVMGIVEAIKFYDPQLHSDKLDRFPQLASLPEVKSRFKIYCAVIKTHYRKLIYAFTDLMSLEFISTLVPHLRQFQALMCLSSCLLSPHLLNPGKGGAAESGIHIPSTKKYNSSQMKAIAATAYIVQKPPDQPSYCLIQGPPGTGKSHTIIGIIQKIKEIKKNCKILLCAPSNGAIDELTRRLIKARHIAQAESREPIKVVRIGNPDNIHEDVSCYSISELVKSNARTETQRCASVYPELEQVLATEKKLVLKLKHLESQEKSVEAEEQKRKLGKDLRNLQEKKRFLSKQFELAQSLNEAPILSSQQETQLRRKILLKADVICSTLNTCGSPHYLNDLSIHPFDCIIIDEASQCTELDSLIPLQYSCCKLILVGDTEQLAPTVLSQKAAEYNYGQSLFERLCNYFKNLEESTSNPVIMLNCQYRMHPEICKFSSRYIYENKLLSDTNLALRTSPINIVPYLLFDIQNGQQVRSPNSGSLSNPLEAEFTVNLCEYLIGLNGSNSTLAIGVIAPYRLQKNLLKDLLMQRKMNKVEVSTVDGFQGREKDIIIMSCVRAQGNFGKIGFLTNRKRLNVALTRAKFALYIVGHLHSLEGADEDWKSLIEDAQQRKLVVRVSNWTSIQQTFQNCIRS